MSWRRVAYAFVPLALLFLASEGVCRAYAEALLASRRASFEVHVHMPARGSTFRGDSLRIVAAGDSWTFGVYVDAAQAWPARVESTLRASGHDAQVVNLGQPGASALRVNQHLAAFLDTNRADIVLWLAGENPTSPEDAGTPAGGALQRVGRGLRGLATWRVLEQVAARGQARRDTVLHRVRRGSSRQITRLSDWETRRADVSSNLRRAETLAVAAGARLVVLTYPIPHELADPGLVDRLCDIAPLDAVIRASAMDQGVELLDLEHIFDEIGFDAVHAGSATLTADPIDTHPSARGYAVMAERIVERL